MYAIEDNMSVRDVWRRRCLEYHFDGEDGGEHVVEQLKELVALTGPRLWVLDRVLRRERHRTRADYDHDEDVEVAQVHDEVAEPAYTSGERLNKLKRVC